MVMCLEVWAGQFFMTSPGQGDETEVFIILSTNDSSCPPECIVSLILFLYSVF